MNIRKILARTWYFIWKDDSLLSWIVNIILAFVITKFLIYPGLGLVLGTTHPVVAVVSGSMVHDAGFDEWWSRNSQFYMDYGVSEEKFKGFIFKNGFNKGDIIVLKTPKDINIGDVIVFKGNSQNPIIHRAIQIDNGKIITKGDHNLQADPVPVDSASVIGKSLFKIPYLGWVKIIFVDSLQTIGVNIS